MPSIGSVIHLDTSGRRAEVIRQIGEGGQGSVFDVTVEGGERLAVKWYHAHTATEAQRRAIADLVERGAPNDRFLWPLELASAPDRSGRQGFGYAMPLRPPQFVGLASLLTGAVDTSLRSVCTIGYQLADSYLRLHAQGLCYRDISFGNVFFDPATGDTLICDNDNVGVDGETSSNVIGTKRFMAPEIVRRLARPSTDTDLYSLSVLLFYLLMVGHPLLGHRELDHPVWNERAESQLFGEHPIFVFDPNDTSNRPVPGLHDAVIANWSIFPSSLQAMFLRAFTRGLSDPRNGRVRESQWRAELVRCRDLLRPCNGCGAMNFHDPARVDRSCWHCNVRMTSPLTLVFGDGTLVLNEGTVVTAHHVGLGPYDFERTIARVMRHPQRADAWGLTNVGGRAWTVTLAGGEVAVIETGRSVGLIPGMSVDFGSAVARLEQPPVGQGNVEPRR